MSVYVEPGKRSIILPAIAADRFYNFSVRAYRRVAGDISSNGALFSDFAKAQSWRYQPTTNVSFDGDITGTIQGIASSKVIADLAGMTSDGVLSRVEKPQLVIYANQVGASATASIAKAQELGGLDPRRNAAMAALVALNDYLAQLAPAWNDLGQDTVIDAQQFQAAWAAMAAAQADLDAAIYIRTSELAKWAGVTGPNKPADNATNTADPDAPFGPDGKTVRDVLEDVANAGPNVEDLLDQADQRAGEIVAAAETRLNGVVAVAKKAGDDADKKAADALLQLNDPASGVVGRLDRFESGFDPENANGFVARLEDVELAVGDETGGLVRKSAELEAASRQDTSFINGNATFSNWPDGQVLPSFCDIGSGSDASNTIRVAGKVGRYAMRQTAAADIDLYVGMSALSLSPGQTDPRMTGGPGTYVVEADFEVVAGSASGAGLYLAAYNDATQGVGSWAQSLASLIGAPIEVGRRYRVSKLVEVPWAGTTSLRFHPMTAWSAFGEARPAKSIVWHLAGSRRATDGEIKAGKADTALNAVGGVVARLNDVVTVVGDANGGLVKRAADLESALNTPGTGVTAKLDEVEEVLTKPGTGLVSKVGTLEVNRRGGGNLVPNSTLSTTDGWSIGSNPGGIYTERNGAGSTWMIGGVENNITLRKAAGAQGFVGEVYSPRFAVRPGSTMQGYALVANHRCRGWVSLFYFDANGAFLTYSGENMAAAGDAGGNDINQWQVVGAKAHLVPPNAVYAHLVLRQYDVTTDGYAWFSRPFACEVLPGATEWVSYSPGNDQPVTAQVASAIRDVAQVLGDANGGIVKRTSDLETTVNKDGTGVVARLGQAERAISNADGTGLAQKTAYLESRSGEAGTALNGNPRFSVPGYTGGVPSGWGPWATTERIVPSEQPGRNGTIPVKMMRDGVYDIGLGLLIENVPAGTYVIESDVQMFGGSWQGAGVYAYSRRPSDGFVYRQFILGFGDTPDIDDFVFNGAAYNRRAWSVLVDVPNQSDIVLHPMGGWGSFPGGAGDAKHTHWHLCQIRPATEGEKKGRKADAAINSPTGVLARLDTNERAISNPDGTGVAQRIGTVEVAVNGNGQPGTGLSGRLTTVEGVTVGPNSRVQTYWQVVADAGNNRRQVRLWSDNNGGGGLDLVGDLSIHGNLFVSGSVDTRVLKDNAVTVTSILTGLNGQGVSVSSTGETPRLAVISETGTFKVDVQLDGTRTFGSGGMYAQLFAFWDGQEMALSRQVYFGFGNTANPITFWGTGQWGMGTTVFFFVRLYGTGNGVWDYNGGAIAATQFKK